MHLVVIHRWKKELSAVAKIIADIMGTLVFEAQQKIAGGGAAVLTSFADRDQAEALAARLSAGEVPAFVVDTEGVRNENQLFFVRSFVLGESALQLESVAGESCAIDYDTIDLMLVATSSAGQSQATNTVTTRKFSLGKTLLAGGLPMTKKMKSDESVIAGERDETLWLYAAKLATVVFDRGIISYDGFDDAKQLTRDLNFSYLKTELRQHAAKAQYDDRLLKRPALIRLLGPTLTPETDLDLAFEILSCSLIDTRHSGATAS